MHSLTLQQVCQILNISSSFSQTQIHGVQVDSRLIKPGDLFIALKGEKTDGHCFLEDVRQKGAIGAIVCKDFQNQHIDFPLIRVEDPLHSFQMLAQKLIQNSSPRIIGVTGSVGKTSTKHFIQTLLEKHYKLIASPRNQNSQIGLPLTILNHTDGTEDVLVLEMGMTEAGHLKQLVQIAPPEVAVITNVELVHAENFHSLKEIALAKGEIFSHPSTRLGILSKENPFFDDLSAIKDFEKRSFSNSFQNADYFIHLKNKQLSIQANIEKKLIELGSISFQGNHHLHNLVAAIAVARYFNIDWESIIHTIPTLHLTERRFEIVHQQSITFINDSYNASEFSIKAALESMPSPKKNGRKIAVIGSMSELGKFSFDCHRNVGHYALDYVEIMYCLGDDCQPIVDIWKNQGRSVCLFQKRDELVRCLKNELKQNDVVLLKGSNYHELWKVLEEI
ncbi:MAG: UDP-N-acetylmuramoyl-tripeptide--D-alanyl-D-alanine ligase [Parachlamydiaceae bacterium]|nr:UDP-N-acetylmuramoyl-tripeptide--D-alanyl-D-alanine ligase [Parachlamydiaceae bacterium]